jgi:hypothetical protein
LTLTRRFTDPAGEHLQSVSARHADAPQPHSAAASKPGAALQIDFSDTEEKTK